VKSANPDLLRKETRNSRLVDMRRRRKHVEPVAHERWLISYADFITLLFAFFVVMFASSETNKAKARQVSASVEKAFSHREAPNKKPAKTNTAKPAPDSEFADLTPSMRLLEEQLADELRTGKMHMSLQARGLVITLGEAAFFATGEDHVQPSAYASLEKVARALGKIPNPVRLEGHSDSTPVHMPRFSSNWELSTARAVQVLKALEERFGTDRLRLSAAGYADTVPVKPNQTEEGRAANRRVDLVVLSRNGSASEPAAKRSER
jgi:chemotaxis protein MotB